MTTDPCARVADANQWERWADEGVPADLKAHAASCAQCAETLATVEFMLGGLEDLGAQDASRVQALDVSDAVLEAVEAEVEGPVVEPAPRRWPRMAGAIALAAAALLAVTLARSAVRIEVEAAAGGTWRDGRTQVALRGPHAFVLPGRLHADGEGAVTGRLPDLRLELSRGAAVSVDAATEVSALAGAVTFRSEAPFQLGTHDVRVHGSGHIQVAEGDDERVNMIDPKRVGGAAALVVAVYAGWATVKTDKVEVEGKAPVGLAVRADGNVDSFALDGDGKVPAKGSEGFATRAVAAKKVPGEAAGDEPSRVEQVSGAFWSEEAQAVRFTLEGEVIDATSGAPITSFSLRAEAESLGDYGARTVSDTFAAEDGKFRLTELAPGAWRITARAEGYAPVTQAVDLRDLGSDPYLVFPLSSGARISGQVVDWKRAPVADAKVGLAACFTVLKGKKGCDLVTTGGDGRFVLEGVPADEAFTLRAEHERLGSATQPNLRRQEGESEHVVLELSGTLRVFGRVVEGKDHAPKAGVEVVAVRADVRTKTDANGAYELFMPLENRPAVRISVKNAQGQPVQFGSYPERRSSEAIKWVEAPTHVAEVNKDFFLAVDKARIHGRITDKTGAPVAGVQLRLWNTTGWYGGPRGHQTFPERTETDADGRYSIEGVPTKAGYTMSYRDAEQRQHDLGYVNVSEEAEVQANFQIGDGRIRGRFVDAETGEPFSISARDCRGNFGARRLSEGAAYFVAPRCLEDGRFELEGMPPGRFRLGSRLVFDDPVLTVEPAEVDLGPGATLSDVVIRVKGDPATRWTFRVLDARGRFVTGLYTRLLKGNRSYTANMDLGADGTAKAEISRAFETVHIDAQGFRSVKVDLRGRDPGQLIELRMQRIE